ncbi:MAG TPA: hypothetical protein VF463_07090, partial [Sphingobium sp.]
AAIATATEAAATTAAEAATITAAAKTIAATAESVATAKAAAVKTAAAAETFVAEAVALVLAASAASSVKTHALLIAFVRPQLLDRTLGEKHTEPPATIRGQLRAITRFPIQREHFPGQLHVFQRTASSCPDIASQRRRHDRPHRRKLD